MIVGRPPAKSRSVTTVLVTLQRPPPLTRILAPSVRAPSTMVTARADCLRRKMAVARPAAPPPMIRTSCACGGTALSISPFVGELLEIGDETAEQRFHRLARKLGARVWRGDRHARRMCDARRRDGRCGVRGRNEIDLPFVRGGRGVRARGAGELGRPKRSDRGRELERLLPAV